MRVRKAELKIMLNNKVIGAFYLALVHLCVCEESEESLHYTPFSFCSQLITHTVQF